MVKANNGEPQWLYLVDLLYGHATDEKAVYLRRARDELVRRLRIADIQAQTLRAFIQMVKGPRERLHAQVDEIADTVLAAAAARAEGKTLEQFAEEWDKSQPPGAKIGSFVAFLRQFGM